jgi:hypothetical protein
MSVTITEITTDYTTEYPTEYTNTGETEGNHKIKCPEIQKMEKKKKKNTHNSSI